MKRFLLYFKLWPYYKSLMGLIFFSVVLTLLYATANVYVMPLIKDITKQVAQRDLIDFSNHIFNAFLLYSIRLGTEYGNMYLMSVISSRFVFQIRSSMYEKLQRLSLSFYNKARFGDLLTYVFSDVSVIQNIFVAFFHRFLPNIVSTFAVLCYLIYISWQLTLVVLVSLPFMLVFNQFFSKKSKRIMGIVQKKSGVLSHIFQETVSNMSIVQSFTTEKKEMQRFQHAQKRNISSSLKEVKIRAIQEPLVYTSQFVVFLLVCWYGGFLVVKGVITAPELTSYFVGILIFVESIVKVSRAYLKMFQAISPLERIFDFMSIDTELSESKNPVSYPKGGNQDIVFKNVSFSYLKQKGNVLNNLNFTIKKGETVALVGLSGAGKSTLLNLMSRFYDPIEGEIQIGGVSLKELSLFDLRSRIAIVPQEVVLFRGTILENLRYGASSATIDDVVKAAKQANAWEFISDMPDKLLTKVGDHGRTLSGGQKQRIAIARAMLRKADILLLDEATSALDSKSEVLVQEALKTLMLNKTSIVIAHRLSTICDANRIFVLKEGYLIESGTHQDLLEKNGEYAMFHQMQFGKKLS